MKKDIRKETAKEIINFIKEQGTVDCNGENVYYVLDFDLDEIKKRYQLD